MKRFILFFVFSVFVTINTYGQISITPNIVADVPMTDGKSLKADVYLPDSSVPKPTILIQTPYNRLLFRFGLPLGFELDISTSNYNFVIVDWRGFYGSAAAAYFGSPNKGEDGADVVKWITSQPWSDGKVGTWGPSALGKVQFETAREQPEGLICGIPLVGISASRYEDFYPGGAQRTEYIDQLDGLGFGVDSAYTAHPTEDLFWTLFESSTTYPEQIAIPMLLIGGWFDHNVNPMIDLFNDLQTKSHVSVRDQHKFLMGPWTHGGHGTSKPGDCIQGELSFNEACGWNDSMALLFFDYYLLGEENGWEENKPFTYFQMGEDKWKGLNSWPLSEITDSSFYLQTDTTISSIGNYTPDTALQLLFDPKDPSPTYGGPTLRFNLKQGPYDQKDTVESRSDILSFDLEIDSSLTVKGKPRVKLFVSSDRKDTDFAIRLCDVHPNEKSYLLLDGIQRMRFRNGTTNSDTSNIVPGQLYEIEIDLPHIAHTFNYGHKLRLDISSSNYPRFDLNLNNGGLLMTAGDTLTATNTIYFSTSHPSQLILPIPTIEVEEVSVSVLERNSLKHYIWPNPTDGRFNLLLLNTEYHKKVDIGIYDLFGKEVVSLYSGKFKREFEFSANLSSGVYYLLGRADGERFVKKLIVLKDD